MRNVYEGNPGCGLRLEGAKSAALDVPERFASGKLVLWARGESTNSAGFTNGQSVPLALADAIALRNALNHAIDREALKR